MTPRFSKFGKARQWDNRASQCGADADVLAAWLHAGWTQRLAGPGQNVPVSYAPEFLKMCSQIRDVIQDSLVWIQCLTVELGTEMEMLEFANMQLRGIPHEKMRFFFAETNMTLCVSSVTPRRAQGNLVKFKFNCLSSETLVSCLSIS